MLTRPVVAVGLAQWAWVPYLTVLTLRRSVAAVGACPHIDDGYHPRCRRSTDDGYHPRLHRHGLGDVCSAVALPPVMCSRSARFCCSAHGVPSHPLSPKGFPVVLSRNPEA